ncbi:MAG TPA: nucleoside-diphosphate sugar epimerase [Rhodospirillaceae bacterium]|nr:nucleoside-diphosphate sugar epimerase [Rhodospirillaceae bacterium]MAX62067.1 nucleoside-diphosphate sugar epimerase [Rhodospirillaceae bacterium]MBB58037.1 nucleoside-diphosphate sugar epimerase [Rhodospirillaceae bacterium]HAE02793.1 nucleoside-diphosphate sugar epimerase [Rhodospirillaceae bacterium]
MRRCDETGAERIGFIVGNLDPAGTPEGDTAMSSIPFETLRPHLEDQRILLVGGAGFIGHNLALELSRMGATVGICDNLMVNSLIENCYEPGRNVVQRTAYQNFLLDRFLLLRENGVMLMNSDARLLADLGRVFEAFQPTKVVHMAAIASAVDAKAEPGLAFDLQLITLRNVLELVRPKVKDINQVMFMSSSTVYGDFEGASVDETTFPRPEGIYANAKFMGERLVRTYRTQYGLGTTVIRPSALYGERCISRRVSQVFIENALTGKPLLLEGGGDGRLDFTYINDLVQGMVRALALHKGHDDSSTYNITFGNARTIADLAAVVKSVVPNAILEDRPRAVDKPIRGTLSIARAQEKLGFEPEWTLEQGFKRYCEWYADQWHRAQMQVEAN